MDYSYDKQVGQKVRWLREAKGLTQEQLPPGSRCGAVT